MTSSGVAIEWSVCNSPSSSSGSSSSVDVETRHFSVLQRYDGVTSPDAMARSGCARCGTRGTLSSRPRRRRAFRLPSTNRSVRLTSIVRVPPSLPARVRPATGRVPATNKRRADGRTDRPTCTYCPSQQQLLSACTRSKLLDRSPTP